VRGKEINIFLSLSGGPDQSREFWEVNIQSTVLTLLVQGGEGGRPYLLRRKRRVGKRGMVLEREIEATGF